MSASTPVKRVCVVRQALSEDPRIRREIDALMEAGYQVDLICMRGEGERRREKVRGVEVHRLPLKHRRAGLGRYLFEYALFPVLAAQKLARLHIRRRYDVVQVNTLPDHLVFAALVPKLLGARVILDLHEQMPEMYAAMFGDAPRVIRFITAVERASTRFADRLIVVHEPHRELLEARGIPARKMTVVLNSADERIFHPPEPAPEAQEGLVLVSHGTMIERLGFDDIIRAVAILSSDRPDVRLVLIGDGEHLPTLRRLAADTGMEDRVEFTGRVALEDIPSHIQTARIGVVPVRPDPFTNLMLPTKLLEYVAMGIPAVAARTHTVQAYFDDSMVAFYDPGDPRDLARAIAELAADPAGARELAATAQRKFLANYSWLAMRQAYVQLMDELSCANGSVRMVEAADASSV